MEREIVLSSYNVKEKDNNRPGNFVTNFNPPLDIQQKSGVFNRIEPYHYNEFHMDKYQRWI